MKVFLTVERGPAKGQEIPLKKQKTVLGKSEQCDVRIMSSVTSRRHCEISLEKDFVSLKDLGSRNGTLLNGKRIGEDSFLADGDEIIVGDAVFKVRITQDERASTHAAIVELVNGVASPAGEAPRAEAAQPPEAAPEPEPPVEPEPPAPIEIVEEEAVALPPLEPQHAAPKPEPPRAEPAKVARPKPEPLRHIMSAGGYRPDSPMTEEIITAESKPASHGFDTGLYERVIEGLVSATESVSIHYERTAYKVRNIMDLLTRVLGIGDEERRNMRLAAMLYEVGKYYIATDVLNKGESMTAVEREHMQKHPQLAIRLFERVQLPVGVREAIAHHHERYDGTGYPDGLKGEEIPAGARMLAIADALAAITSSRPYRPAMSTPQALDELEKNAGAQFDPAMIEKFVDYCRLHSGELRDAVTFR
jgi:HD-GYP domain-containing protein (c-di-GMP phosphodiesterase class II)